MTPKQRAKIYRKAAEDVFKEEFKPCCIAIEDASELVNRPDEWWALFVEFNLFKPGHADAYWWDYPPQDREPRILALLLCEQIALSTPS